MEVIWAVIVPALCPVMVFRTVSIRPFAAQPCLNYLKISGSSQETGCQFRSSSDRLCLAIVTPRFAEQEPASIGPAIMPVT
jgi:hypothetical protein